MSCLTSTMPAKSDPNYMNVICIIFEKKNQVVPSSDLLISTGDDEVCTVHRNEIGSELTGKVVFLFKVFPVNIRVWVLCLFQSMGDNTLQENTVLGVRTRYVSIKYWLGNNN